MTACPSEQFSLAIHAQAMKPTPGKYNRRLVNVHKKES